MAKVEILSPFLRKWEGGYVNHPNDPGGPTNMGVTLNAWKAYGYDKTGDKKIDASDIKVLSPADFTHVLKIGYWNRWDADNIQDQAVANTLVDWVWGSGKWGITIPQRLLGVTQDGVVGPKTIQALNKQNPKEFLEKLYAARYQYLKDIVKANSKLAVFTKGWNNRMDDLVKFNKSIK